MPTVLIANVTVCQSKELKCDSRVPESAHAVSLRAVCPPGEQLLVPLLFRPLTAVRASRGTGGVGSPCTSLLRAKRTFGHMGKDLWVHGGAPLAPAPGAQLYFSLGKA